MNIIPKVVLPSLLVFILLFVIISILPTYATSDNNNSTESNINGTSKSPIPLIIFQVVALDGSDQSFALTPDDYNSLLNKLGETTLQYIAKTDSTNSGAYGYLTNLETVLSFISKHTPLPSEADPVTQAMVKAENTAEALAHIEFAVNQLDASVLSQAGNAADEAALAKAEAADEALAKAEAADEATIKAATLAKAAAVDETLAKAAEDAKVAADEALAKAAAANAAAAKAAVMYQ